MEVLTLSILFGMIVLSDEVLNGRLQLSRRLLEQLDRMGTPNSNSQTNSNKPAQH